MDLVEMLVRARVDHPRCKETKKALLDAILERDGGSMGTARKTVCRLFRVARDARELEQAAREIRPDGVWHDRLTERIRLWAGLAHNNAYSIALVPGSAPPVWVRRSEYHVGVSYSTICVTVGAGWVTDQVAVMWEGLIEYAHLLSTDEHERLLANSKDEWAHR